MFFTNGGLFANLLPRFPQLKDALGMDNATYGLAVAAFPAGAILAGLASGLLIRRFGSARVAVGATLVTALGVLAAGLAPAPLAFAACLLCAGAADSICDVGMNAHGLRVQRRFGRSIINSFHAVWSIGAVTGGSMAAAALALDIPVGIHLAISGALFSAIALVSLRFALPGTDTERHSVALEPDAPEAAPDAASPPAVLSRGRLVLTVACLVGIAVAGSFVEDAGNSWAAIYLAGPLGAPATIAALGYIALTGAQFAGRLVGDRLVDRFGQRAVARAGAALAAVGMGLALALPSVPGTIAGFAAAGLGVATLVPAAMSEADALPGLRPGTGLTIVSWLMRLGFLASPPLVGLIADRADLRAGLLTVPAAGLAVVALAAVLAPRARARRTPGQGAAD
ncbi:MFS transporter [Brevibacterium sp. 5221]|uniref:MFS transporter n=1 Tax=Brevibacterium rongguiense TaxID=2695267 RepID=A0A6N9H7H9_9MICO|nr:MFS transporter [Brevibacterium rongguiense]MYM19841.1 MFS transporter [Brevibacterium rongguiense]